MQLQSGSVGKEKNGGMNQGELNNEEGARIIAKFRLKLKKVGKTTRPFRYDLSQIPYNYTVKVTNRFKELDLIDRVPEELWMEWEVVIKTIPQEKEIQKGKMVL